MCGIAGILYKGEGTGRNSSTGAALVDMLDGCQHRGPDSTGFALYGEAQSNRLRLRFFVGSGDEADKAVEQLLSGEKQDVHEVMLSMAKADVSFRMMIEVRNKLVEAYQEVMRMQV